MTRRILVLAALVIAAAALLTTPFLRARQVPQSAERPVTETVGITQVAPDRLRYPPGAPQLAHLKIQPVTETLEPTLEPLNARVSYDENRTARVTSPISGRVLKLLVQPGDEVKAQQPLAVLDAPDYAAALADSRKAEADLSLKRLAFERAKTLFDGGVLARKDMEAAQSDLRQSQAETARATSRLKNLGTAGAEGFVLRAPLAGTVAERNLNPAQEVRPDAPNPLFVITDPRQLWLMLELPEQDVGKLAKGQPIAVETDAWPGSVFRATVVSIGVTLDPQSRRIPVRAAIVNSEGKLRPEMFVRATPLNTEQRKAIAVPNSAVITSGLYSHVFVEVEPGVLQKRRVDIGVRGREQSYVRAGIATGERIVTSGALLLDSELASSG